MPFLEAPSDCCPGILAGLSFTEKSILRSWEFADQITVEIAYDIHLFNYLNPPNHSSNKQFICYYYGGAQLLFHNPDFSLLASGQ